MTVWFKNKQSGATWEITDETKIAEYKKDDNFEEVDDPTEDAAKGANKRKGSGAAESDA